MQPDDSKAADWGVELIRSGWLEQVRTTWRLSYRGMAVLLGTDGDTMRIWCSGNARTPRRYNGHKVADFQVRYGFDCQFLTDHGLSPSDLTSITEVGMRLGVGAGTVAGWVHGFGLKLYRLDAMGAMMLSSEVSYLRRRVRM